jgi:hypothetical protein
MPASNWKLPSSLALSAIRRFRFMCFEPFWGLCCEMPCFFLLPCASQNTCLSISIRSSNSQM